MWISFWGNFYILAEATLRWPPKGPRLGEAVRGQLPQFFGGKWSPGPAALAGLRSLPVLGDSGASRGLRIAGPELLLFKRPASPGCAPSNSAQRASPQEEEGW